MVFVLEAVESSLSGYSHHCVVFIFLMITLQPKMLGALEPTPRRRKRISTFKSISY